MAGIGVKLTKVFEKRSVFASLAGFAYSTAVTAMPMIVVIANIIFMTWIMGINNCTYLSREVFYCTILYVFIFALLTASPFNSVLSKYMQDAIFEERYQDILPCYYLGIWMNITLSCMVGIPFCLWEHFVGKVAVFYVFLGFCCYAALVFTFYSMLYMSICKDYSRISLYFFLGMLATLITALCLWHFAKWETTVAILFGLVVGFLLCGVLEFSTVRGYFRQNSRRYKPVLLYFKKWWKLVLANFLYVLGLYIHNFVFWGTDLRIIVVKSFICAPVYDDATCIAMFTNLSATVIFIARVEMYFHDKYKAYSEAVIGGKWADIDNSKRRMFRSISNELMSLVRLQFIVSVVIYLVAVVVLPSFGFGGMVMRIYPCLAAGYFILFLMYSAIIFLYYYNDLSGAVLTSLVFCLVTFIGSILVSRLPEIWYGLGVVAGSFAGWSVAYARLRCVERHMDRNMFCVWRMLEPADGPMPSSMTYSKGNGA